MFFVVQEHILKIAPKAQPGGQLLGRRRRHLEIQVDILAGELYLEFFIWFWGRGKRYLRMETGVLHRIAIQISRA